nr:hypothetical protein [Burkholderia dolosa]
MVRPILEGRKTQTRRIVKLPHTNPLGVWEPTTIGGENGGRTASGETVPLQGAIWHTRTGDCLISPHGQPGDRLWVREAHIAYGRWETRFSEKKGRDAWHFIDMTLETGREYRFDGDLPNAARSGATPAWWRRPSIFMPRAAARTLLEVTGVRVERLQRISEPDARAEGVTIEEHHMRGYCAGAYRPPSIRAFHDLWDSLNAARGHGWDVNPWVWVVEFKRLGAGE